METITLKYGANTKAYSVLGVKGFDDVDELGFWPAISAQLLDGSRKEYISGYQRIITVDFGVIQAKADRVWLVGFLMSDAKKLSCPAEDVDVVLEDPQGVVNEWLDGLEFARAFSIRFIEKAVRSTDPDAW